MGYAKSIVIYELLLNFLIQFLSYGWIQVEMNHHQPEERTVRYAMDMVDLLN